MLLGLIITGAAMGYSNGEESQRRLLAEKEMGSDVNFDNPVFDED